MAEVKAVRPPRLLLRLPLALLALAAALPAAEASFAYAEATIEDLQARMAAGRLTARELTAAYLERIARIDQAGPRLRAVIEVNPDALRQAEELNPDPPTKALISELLASLK